MEYRKGCLSRRDFLSLFACKALDMLGNCAVNDWRQLVVSSIGRCNTYLEMRAWSDGDEAKTTQNHDHGSRERRVVGSVEEGREAACDRRGAGPGTHQHRRAYPANWRHPAARSTKIDARFDASGARGNLEGLVEGQSLRAIARALGRAASTISREIARNGGSRRYRADDRPPPSGASRLLVHHQL